MVRVVVVVVGVGGGVGAPPPPWGNFVRPLDDLVAKSTNNGTNNLGRSQNCKNPDLKKFLPVANPCRENHPKRFILQFYGPRSAQTENFIKLKISGTPILCWADQVKFEF